MDTPDFSKENIKPLFESKFIRVFDLQYAEGKHYYDATRRTADDLVAAKTTEEFKKMLADAVTCIVVLNIKDSEPKLLLSHEFRYPTGQFLLSPPAGLIDKEDADLITTATRELKEETGIVFGDNDTAKVISPLLFSTPGMTDESNALVLLSINRDALPELNTDGAVGSECFNGFSLLTKEEALQLGRDLLIRELRTDSSEILSLSFKSQETENGITLYLTAECIANIAEEIKIISPEGE